MPPFLTLVRTILRVQDPSHPIQETERSHRVYVRQRVQMSYTYVRHPFGLPLFCSSAALDPSLGQATAPTFAVYQHYQASVPSMSTSDDRLVVRGWQKTSISGYDRAI